MYHTHAHLFFAAFENATTQKSEIKDCTEQKGTKIKKEDKSKTIFSGNRDYATTALMVLNKEGVSVSIISEMQRLPLMRHVAF